MAFWSLKPAPRAFRGSVRYSDSFGMATALSTLAPSKGEKKSTEPEGPPPLKAACDYDYDYASAGKFEVYPKKSSV